MFRAVSPVILRALAVSIAEFFIIIYASYTCHCVAIVILYKNSIYCNDFVFIVNI